MKYLLLTLITIALSHDSCQLNSGSSAHANQNSDQHMDARLLDKIWYQGKAEISTYELTQNRYEELHPGEWVMIFVSEDFLTDKQVKNDTYTSDKSTPILKNNSIRRFTTGLYDYSIFTSVFTDVSSPERLNTLKVTMSSQDWCGQSFVQLNNKGKKNRIRSYSYFENEGDEDITISDVVLVDEIFNLVRLGDKYLPQDEFKVLPGFMFARLAHKEIKPYTATGSIIRSDAAPISVYTLSISELSYKLAIEYNSDGNGAKEILSISESYPSAFDGKIRTTTAELKERQWLPYWTMNSLKDSTARSELGLQ